MTKGPCRHKETWWWNGEVAAAVREKKIKYGKWKKENTKKAGMEYKKSRTRSSVIAEGPRDPSCQLKSCQLPRNSAETTCTTSPEQIKVTKLEDYGGPMFNKHVRLCSQP